MAKRDIGTTVAAAIGALSAVGIGLWLALRPGTKQTQGVPKPNSGGACPEGFYRKSDGQCAPVTTAPGAVDLVYYPANPRILFLGGEIALNTANAMNFILQSGQQRSGAPVAPANIKVWNGTGVAQIETYAAAIKNTGLPAEVVDDKPTFAIVMLSEWNAKYGPADPEAKNGELDALTVILKALSGLLPSERASGAPLPATNIILVKPWQQKLPHTLDMMNAMNAAALGGAGRVFPFSPRSSAIALGDDDMTPTSEGYAALAQQLAALITQKYASVLKDTPTT